MPNDECLKNDEARIPKKLSRPVADPWDFPKSQGSFPGDAHSFFFIRDSLLDTRINRIHSEKQHAWTQAYNLPF